jgi:hypothetical protein
MFVPFMLAVVVASAPVHVSGCKNDPIYDYTGGDTTVRSIAGRDLDISFVNVSKIPISAVAFTLKDGASTQTYVDNGTFAPGVTIVKRIFSPFKNSGTISCSVSGADFNDGGMWMMRTRP